jgi:hypothetical protein
MPPKFPKPVQFYLLVLLMLLAGVLISLGVQAVWP